MLLRKWLSVLLTLTVLKADGYTFQVGYTHQEYTTTLTTGETAYPNQTIQMFIGADPSLIDEFLDLRFGVGFPMGMLNDSLRTQFETFYIDATLMMFLGESIHIGFGIRYDIDSSLVPFDASLPREALESELGINYILEYIADGSRHVYPVYSLKYSQVSYTNTISGTLFQGDHIGLYIGFYYFSY